MEAKTPRSCESCKEKGRHARLVDPRHTFISISRPDIFLKGESLMTVCFFSNLFYCDGKTSAEHAYNTMDATTTGTINNNIGELTE